MAYEQYWGPGEWDTLQFILKLQTHGHGGEAWEIHTYVYDESGNDKGPTKNEGDTGTITIVGTDDGFESVNFGLMDTDHYVTTTVENGYIKSVVGTNDGQWTTFWMDNVDEIVLTAFNDNAIDLSGWDQAMVIRGGYQHDSYTMTDFGDTFVKTYGSSTVTGGAGDDAFQLYGGVNTVSGGAGNDAFYLSGGTNTVTGGAGADWFKLTGGQNTFTDFYVREGDSIRLDATAYGITGTDDLDWRYSTDAAGNDTWYLVTYNPDGTANVVATFQNWTAYSADFDFDGFSFEYHLDSGQNTVSGTDGSDEFFITGGANTISGFYGSDIYHLEGGTNTVAGGIGANVFNFGGGTNTVTGEYGDDIFRFSDGTNTVSGGDGADTFYFAGGTNIITDFDMSEGDTLEVNAAAYGIDSTDDFFWQLGKLKGQEGPSQWMLLTHDEEGEAVHIASFENWSAQDNGFRTDFIKLDTTPAEELAF